MSSGEDDPELAVDEAEAEDAATAVDLVTELKEEGTTLFRRRDYDGAAFKFDEAIRLSPRARDDDIASLHSNVAACYMHMHREEYLHQAIDRCNMALEASPRYTKALLKRARCLEALDRLDLACGDVQKVLSLEPNNVVALELMESIREEMEEKKLLLEQEARSLDELIKATFASGVQNCTTGSTQMDGHSTQDQESHGEQEEQHASYANGGQEKHGLPEEHVAVQSEDDKQEEQQGTDNQEQGDVGCGAKRCVEFVLGDDIKVALIPEDCSVLELMDMARENFPDLKALFVNFKDDRGNLVTINSTTELPRFEEANSQSQMPLRLYVTEDNLERVCCPDLPVRQNEPTQCLSHDQ